MKVWLRGVRWLNRACEVRSISEKFLIIGLDRRIGTLNLGKECECKGTR